MKAKQVLEILNCTAGTLRRYRLNGKIKATELPTGRFDYDGDSVYNFKNKTKKRLTIIYGRVSTYAQKPDLANQMQDLKDFCKARGYSINQEYHDIASGISFKRRKDFFKMLPLILQGKVKRVVITHKDRLSRVGFDLFKYLFHYYDTEIVVMSDLLDQKTDEQEVFEEIIALLHCFSMRMYGSRRYLRQKINREGEPNDRKNSRQKKCKKAKVK